MLKILVDKCGNTVVSNKWNIQYIAMFVNSKTHVVTVLWLDSDDEVTIPSPTSGTSGRLQNRVSVSPWFLHSDCVTGT